MTEQPSPRKTIGKNPLRFLLMLWMGLALALLLTARNEFAGEAAYFALLPMAGLLAMLIRKKDFSLSGLFAREKRGIWLPALLLTALFFLLLSLPNLFSQPLFSEAALSTIWWPFRWLRLLYLAWNWTGFLLGYVLAVFLCLCFLLDWLLREPRPDEAPAAAIPYTGLYRPILPLLLACALSLASTSPSLLIGDASTVLAWARDGIWSEWHTGGYLLFVRLIWLLTHSSRGVTVVQAVAYVYIHNYALGLLRRQGVGKRGMLAYALACTLAFVPVYFLQAVLKDVVFSMSALAFGLGVLSVVNREKPRIRDLVWMGTFGLCTCLFRHAGWLPVGGTLLALLIRGAVRQRKALLGTLATGVCLFCCYFLINNVLVLGMLQAEKNPDIIAYSAPMTMIGAVAASGEPIDTGDKALMEQVMPVEKWAACYDAYFADSLSRQYGKIGDDANKVNDLHLGPDLIRLNWHFFTKYPATYLRAFFNLNSLMWEIATPVDGYVRSYLSYPGTAIAELVTAEGYAEEGVDRITKELKQPEDTTFTAAGILVNRYAEFLYGVPVLRDILWRGGFSLFLLAVSAVVLIKKRRSRDLLGMLPMGLIALGMLVSMPAQEVRYIFPNLEYALFFTVYCGAVGKERA